ncbi:MAG: shikimate dehydrogenase [Parvularculaceae bacterium]
MTVTHGFPADILPRRAGMLGWPVAHSLSPLIHTTWAAREGIDAGYDPIAVAPDDGAFRGAIERLRNEGYRGVNVTLPHKERALKFADQASEEAIAAGAANMLTFTASGIAAGNSDIAGFAAAVMETGATPRAALILGAGGAARGVAIALSRRLGARSIVVANRTRARAEVVAALAGGAAIDWSARGAALADIDLLVNTTSLGMTGEAALDLDLDALPRSALVADIVYAPLETPLLAAARARGHTTIDGLSMLMHQAAYGYRAWLGATAVVDADLRARLEAALAARLAR